MSIPRRQNSSNLVTEWSRSQKPWWATIKGDFVGTLDPITVATSATANVKGAWVQLIASTSANADVVVFLADTSVNSNYATLLDFAIGAAGAETAIIQNIAVGNHENDSFNRGLFYFVAQVPAGSRLSARTQGVTPYSPNIGVTLLNTGFYSSAPTSATVFGSSTTNSAGTGITTSYTEIVSSLSTSYSGFVLVPSLNATSVSIVASETFTLAAGAAGAEVDYGSITVRTDNTEQIWSPFGTIPFIRGPFSAGTRIAVKSSSATNAFSKCVCLIGIPFV